MVGGKFILLSRTFPFTHMREYGENRFYEYLTFAHILVKAGGLPWCVQRANRIA